MKKKLKSRNSNSKRSAPAALVVAVLLCVAFASTTQIFAQRRLGRPPSGRQLEGTPILAAGTSVIPDGTVLVIEMGTKLNSGTAQVSDRFLARIATPVIDAGGRTLLDSGTPIEGHVASVKKAKWGHRSGELGLSFDWIEYGDGRRIPLRGTLVSGSNPIDGEGDLRAKSAAKRDVLVTTGGAVAGAGIGMVTGASILVGGGAGAAAGLTLVLAMKGKNVDIDPGERFNLQLVQPMSLTGRRVGTGTRYGGSGAFRTPIPLQSRGRGGTVPLRPGAGFIPGPYSGGSSYNDPNSIRTAWSRVPISDVRAERDRDGMLRVLVTAETSTPGWRIYTNHEVQRRDTLDIRLMGIPPSQYGARQLSRPTAPPICVEDRNSEIRRIVVHGQNGVRYLTIGPGSTTAQPDPYSRPSSSNRQSYPPLPQTGRPRPGPSDGSPGSIFAPPGPSTGVPSGSTAISQLATRTANEVEVLRYNYAAAVGQLIRTDGTTESLGGHRTTPTEQQLLESLGYLESYARSLAAPSLDAYSRQRAAQQLQRETQSAEQLWQRVRSSSGVITRDLDGQWQSAQNNLRALISAASR